MRCLAAIGSLLLAAALVVVPARGLPQDEPSRSPGMAGSRTYKLYCAVCHGEKGKGDGPLAEGLRSAPPDLTLMAKGNGGEYPAEEIARIVDGRKPLMGHGGPDMPIWGDVFKKSGSGSDDETVKQKIESVVAFLERLQEK
jgi:mono/diheme cytochrome c family protein